MAIRKAGEEPVPAVSVRYLRSGRVGPPILGGGGGGGGGREQTMERGKKTQRKWKERERGEFMWNKMMNYRHTQLTQL